MPGLGKDTPSVSINVHMPKVLQVITITNDSKSHEKQKLIQQD